MRHPKVESIGVVARVGGILLSVGGGNTNEVHSAVPTQPDPPPLPITFLFCMHSAQLGLSVCKMPAIDMNAINGMINGYSGHGGYPTPGMINGYSGHGGYPTPAPTPSYATTSIDQDWEHPNFYKQKKARCGAPVSGQYLFKYSLTSAQCKDFCKGKKREISIHNSLTYNIKATCMCYKTEQCSLSSDGAKLSSETQVSQPYFRHTPAPHHTPHTPQLRTVEPYPAPTVPGLTAVIFLSGGLRMEGDAISLLGTKTIQHAAPIDNMFWRFHTGWGSGFGFLGLPSKHGDSTTEQQWYFRQFGYVNS